MATGVGVMLQPKSFYAHRVEGEGFPAWAADNGCFAQGAAFELGAFYAWLATVPRSRLLFAVAPDVFPHAEATLARSRSVLKELRAMGLPAAFVAQNYAEQGEIPWDEFDALFLGGQDHWKLGRGARQLVTEAKRRGKWTHMGRVNSARRLHYAAMIGCDSADGTYIQFRNRKGQDTAPEEIARWFSQRVLVMP